MRATRLALALLLSAAACGDSGAPALAADGGPPPSLFTLTDINPASPTYNEGRSLVAVHGTVVVLYFVSFG